ncbi:hypothetical protein [Rickettsia endosymbiont of Aspidapion aeneum]
MTSKIRAMQQRLMIPSHATTPPRNDDSPFLSLKTSHLIFFIKFRFE